MSTTTAIGLRERKKQQTRATISEVATRLFADRGFEQTTIADVAAEAGVAKMTVTNYFPLKEDLVFDRAPEIVAMPGDAVAGRDPGVTPSQAILDAYREQLAASNPTLGFLGVRFAEMVEGSAALRARERVMFDEREQALAGVLATELPDAAPAAVAMTAAQLSGALRVLYFEARRRLLAGEPTPNTITALGREAQALFAQVTGGLASELDPPRTRF